MKRQRVVVCFEAHHPDGRVWAVRVGRTWHRTKRVLIIGVDLETVYRGPAARQPRAYFTGRAVVTQQAHATILSRV